MWYEWRVEASEGFGERSDVGPDGSSAEEEEEEEEEGLYFAEGVVGGRDVAEMRAAWTRGFVGKRAEGSWGKPSSQSNRGKAFQNEGGMSHSIFLP